jgi:pectate lyase
MSWELIDELCRDHGDRPVDLIILLSDIAVQFFLRIVRMKPASRSHSNALVRRATRPATLLATAVFLCGAAATAQAIPVIPGAAGFGMDTKAGRGGAVFRVTNLNASGTGSLKACVDGTGPRTCVFEVSGTIKLTYDLIIRNDNIRIAGQTAPSPGIMIRGAGIKIIASDVVIQHLRVRPGDATTGPDPENRDSLRISGSTERPVRNVVIDHCSFSWSIDEIASTWGPHDNITFTNNIFSEPLHQSLHPDYDGSGTMPHGYGVLFGQSDNSSITFANNLLAHIVERNPLSRAAEFVFVNNVVYDRGTMDLDVQSEDRKVTKSSVVGNLFLRGPSFSRETKPIFVHTKGTYTLVYGSRVYVHDNRAPDSGSSYSQLVTLTGGDVISNLMTTTSVPVWNSGLVARSSSNNAVYDHVLVHAGARPTDRDSVDKRIVLEVRQRTGKVINCVASNGTTRCSKNAGGWPTLAVNRRTLTLPSSHSSIASNGYSNLENWLNTMDRSINDGAQASSPSSSPALSVQ